MPGDQIRSHTAKVLSEISFDAAPQKVDEKLRRLAEVELSWRVRSKLAGEVYLNASGKAGRNDIEDFDKRVAVEIKFFLSFMADGTTAAKNTALEDWRWLLGAKPKGAEYARDWRRLWICFYPRGSEGANVSGTSDRKKPPIGTFLFQDLISVAPTKSRDYALEEFLPFAPFAKPVRPGKPQTRQNLSFRADPVPRTVLVTRGTAVRCDILKSPMESPLWAAVYEPVSTVVARKLQASGYVIFDAR